MATSQKIPGPGTPKMLGREEREGSRPRRVSASAHQRPSSTASSAMPSQVSPGAPSPLPPSRDDLVMDTNNSSIVSKRSVEKLYAAGEPEYFRYFVGKFKRRSPLINRGYWLRMRAVESAVTRVLAEQTLERKLVINLGCGYDPLPFSFLGRHRDLCENALFVDVDFPPLLRNKMSVIAKTEQLRSLVPDITFTGAESGLLALSESYAAVGCDLRELKALSAVLQQHFRIETTPVTIMFVAEVSIAYMEPSASQAILQWASAYDRVAFTLLEQQIPDGYDHPFAVTMSSHFNKLRTPLHTLGTLEQMRSRFVAAGWPERGIEAHSLWELWSEPSFLSADVRRWLDTVEPFDEWEEFALFASHYFLLVAEKKVDQSYEYKPNRASMAGSRPETMSDEAIAPSPISQASDPDPAHALMAHELPTTHVPRRFAALLPATSKPQDTDAVGLHGGLGSQERRDDCDTYACSDSVQPVDGPPLRTGIMCHTITRLGGTGDCMLVGGRNSPDKALPDCWLRQGGLWQKVADLPIGRYRHSAVSLRLPTEPQPAHTVLVFGGKASDGSVLDDWLLWTGGQGWQRLQMAGECPAARFGAAMIGDKVESISGIIVGGLTAGGRTLADFWHWELRPDMSVECYNVTARAAGVLKSDAWLLGRFGAQAVRSDQGILLVGGIAGGRMLSHGEQILNMRTLRTIPVRGARQLYVGCSVQQIEGGILILGGGATCFSFGTFWNKSCLLTTASERQAATSWQLVPRGARTGFVSTPRADSENSSLRDARASTLASSARSSAAVSIRSRVEPRSAAASTAVDDSSTGSSLVQPSTGAERGGPSASLPTPIAVARVQLSDSQRFEGYLQAAQPVIFSGVSLGRCTRYWTDEYLKERVGEDREVVVHASPSEKMDFQSKNFSYVTQRFGDFIDAAASGERVYLRALSKEQPSKKPTSLANDFPELAMDFQLPAELDHVVDHAHSTPLRISGPVAMWLHYDVMDNILCQIRGHKRVLLFPPSDVAQMGFAAGASSSSLDVFGQAGEMGAADTHPYEAQLGPGDVLLIPSTWAHAAAPDAAAGSSVAVNCFFRGMGESAYAAGRDVYGNRDVAAYERGRRDVARIARGFDELPPHVAAFYLERLAMELRGLARKAGEAGGDTIAELA